MTKVAAKNAELEKENEDLAVKVVSNLSNMSINQLANWLQYLLQNNLNAKSIQFSEKDAALEKKNQDLSSNFVTCLELKYIALIFIVFSL